MRIAIFGSGGVGGYFGGRLALASNDVTFIARGGHLRALRSTGLRVDSIKGNFTVSPVRVTDDPAQVLNLKTERSPDLGEKLESKHPLTAFSPPAPCRWKCGPVPNCSFLNKVKSHPNPVFVVIQNSLGINQ